MVKIAIQYYILLVLIIAFGIMFYIDYSNLPQEEISTENSLSINNLTLKENLTPSQNESNIVSTSEPIETKAIESENEVPPRCETFCIDLCRINDKELKSWEDAGDGACHCQCK